MSPSQSEDVQTLGFQAMAVTDVTLKSQAGEGTAYHSYGEEKVSIFSEFINSVLAADPHLSDVLPVDPHSDNLFVAIQSGILLCKLINLTQPGIIFEKAINLKVKTIHHKLENQNLAINSAKAIGCNVVNISAEDLIEGKPHLVLGLVWQIIKIMLFKKVSLREVPELAALLKEGEQLADFLKLSPEEILLRWVNYHLEKAGCDRTCTNFGSDMKDGVVYTHLMQQICPEHCTLDPLSEADPRKRAGKILVNAQRMDCRKFVTPEHIVNGNAQMNMAFTALLYNKFPGLSLPVESGVRAEMAELLEEQGSEDSREERVFRNWINSLGLSRDVNALAEDCRSGEVLLEAMEKLVPQAVDWKQVTKNTKIQIKTIQNCNYAVNVANKIGIKTVNLGGADIAGGGNLKLLLGLMWQLMRFDTISLLEKLGGGKKVSDSDMVKWANEKVGSKGKMASFQDAELASGRFFLYLCDSITPGVVNWDIVTPGVKDEDKEMNAKYVLSVARKMGATPFLLWEDIVEVKPKMLMTLVGAIMVLDRQSRIKQKEAGQAV